MAKKKQVLPPRVRQDGPSATAFLDRYKGVFDPDTRKMVEELFTQDAKDGKGHTAEFLLTYLSAILFVRQFLSNRGCERGTIGLCSAIAIEVATRYNTLVEHHLAEICRYGTDFDPFEQIKRE